MLVSDDSHAGDFNVKLIFVNINDLKSSDSDLKFASDSESASLSQFNSLSFRHFLPSVDKKGSNVISCSSFKLDFLFFREKPYLRNKYLSLKKWSQVLQQKIPTTTQEYKTDKVNEVNSENFDIDKI